MKFDLIYVTYNSEKWINKCFDSLLLDDVRSRDLNIYVVDNSSSDETIGLLEQFKEQKGSLFSSFHIVKEKENIGFGRANNHGFLQGNSEIVCFFNVDTELNIKTIEELEKDIALSDDDVAVWELRQFPYEHPKNYDILSGETTWVSGAAFAVRRSVFSKVNGFDDKIFMYAEDVDLSWRIRDAGYKLKYVPRAIIYHYSYESAGEVKPTQHVYSVINNLLLRYRFGNIMKIAWGHLHFWGLMRRPGAFPGAKRMLIKEYFRHFLLIGHFRCHGKYRRKRVARFLGWDYATVREGAFYFNKLPESKPLVSVIVRTCGRPTVLRETLISLRKQTYNNIEIVVVEDGEAKSEKMIKEEFSDLNIHYKASGKKVGRSKAGNMAMMLAKGKYLNFLDDDDLFYADHVEVLVSTLEKSKNRAAYAFAFETPINVKSKEPYIYELGDYNSVHKKEFDRVELCYHNYIPIQTIMFEKSLFEEHGGFDEQLDALEDWDLWVRYSLYTDFDCVKKTTSIYRVPMLAKISAQRQKELDEALLVVREKHKTYPRTLSVYDVQRLYQSNMM